MALKIGLHNAFNMVSRQALLDEFPRAGTMGSLVLWPTSSTIPPNGYHHLRDEGDLLGPILFCMVLQKIIFAFGMDPTCNDLKFHSWYLDDGVVAGPSQAVKQVISILHSQGPPLGMFLNTSKV